MKETKNEKLVTGNQVEEQNKSSQNGQGKAKGKSEKEPTMVENAQADVPKEHKDNDHQHDAKTPVGDMKKVNENNNSTKISVKGL